MLNKIIISGVFSLFFGTGIAFAQSNVTGGTDVVLDLMASRDQAIKTYLESTTELDLGLKKAAEAFGVNNEVLEKIALVESLQEVNFNVNVFSALNLDSTLDQARQAAEKAQAIITQKMEQISAPSDENKALLAESMIHIANSIQKDNTLMEMLEKMTPKMKEAQKAMSTGIPSDEIQKVEDASAATMVLATAYGMYSKLEKNILVAYVAYAKENNITIPSNTSDLLKE